ncbi:hypothetical protein [Cellulomonas denverensis]|uniref:Uncharacterized protein n=1 Tax=Cellulomonas denverensis TaxID=264297 RepID=A0A7X6QXS5_9CELL|nr:hypothetical protein [Cellulomonas denverensis]NKY21368.1 hypothetical protein [Cellulomonas denverensis]GIG27309.1 hypothetical protein Cde04nite_35530 [Cellulomonas denverensis]
MSISAVSDPLAALSTPTSDSENYIWLVRAKCGVVAGGIDGVIAWLTGFSPLNEWVFKPLAGDWVGLDKGSSAWANAGKAASAITENLRELPAQIGDGWCGEPAQAFKQSMKKIDRELNELPSACAQMSEMVAAISDAAKAIADLIAVGINELVTFALSRLPATAVPVVGQAAIPLVVADLVARITRFSARLGQMITRFFELVRKIVPIIVKVRNVLHKLKLLKDAASLIPVVGAGAKAAVTYADAYQKVTTPVFSGGAS